MRVVVVILWHGVPPEATFVGVGDGRGQSDAPSAHGFGSVLVGDKCSVVKIRVKT